jgi:hypothetical protein
VLLCRTINADIIAVQQQHDSPGKDVPIDYRVDEHRKLVSTRLHGVVTEADLRAYAERNARDAGSLRCDRAIVEVAPDAELNISHELITAFSLGNDRATLPTRRVAVVASTDLSYGYARMFQGFREDPNAEVQVFRTRADAKAWLGLA